MARRIILEVIWVAMLPISLLAHLAGYRRVPIKIDRIGHLASEFDCFLKELKLGRRPRRRWFVVASRGQVANACLLEYWKLHVAVVQQPVIALLLEAMARHGVMVIDISRNMPVLKGTANYYSVLAQWGDRPPLLTLGEEHRERGWITLENIGVPREAWFVAIHAREPGFSAHDESAHAHRNSDIRKLIPAIREIRRRGGWVFRMGDPSMQPLPTVDGVIDYAHHSSRSDWMDVFLCAEARFFVGNTSGLYLLSTVFGTPCALANVIPSSHLAFAPTDLSILKLIWSNPENRYLRFDEIFERSVSEYRFADLFAGEGLRVEENSEEELSGLVTEMLDRVEGRFKATLDDEALQQRFLSFFRPGHFGYGVAGRAGSDFLRRHRQLLRCDFF